MPLKPVQLLHHLIRHLYLRLKELELLATLPDELNEDLRTAFLRTSFEISSRSLMGEEQGRGLEVGFGTAPWLGLEFLGKLSSTYKRTQNEEEALKYLPYDEKAAEFDIMSFSRLLLGLEATRKESLASVVESSFSLTYPPLAHPCGICSR